MIVDRDREKIAGRRSGVEEIAQEEIKDFYRKNALTVLDEFENDIFGLKRTLKRRKDRNVLI